MNKPLPKNNIPEEAFDYEFIVCFKDEKKKKDFLFYFSYTVDAFEAERTCLSLYNMGVEPIILHNVRIQGKVR